jgi:hypothetical protein
MMAQFAEAGKLTRDDIRELEKVLTQRERAKAEKTGRSS